MTSQPVHVRPYTWLVLTIGSLAGLAMFLWPLLALPPAHRTTSRRRSSSC